MTPEDGRGRELDLNRLDATFVAKGDVRAPGYIPEDHGIGIVHIGVGAFHRAHQAVYTDDVLARDGGDWRILGVNLNSATAANSLNPQDGRYSLAIRGDDGALNLRVIGSLANVIAARSGTGGLYEVMAAPTTRIVSLTVTEKAYGIVRAEGIVDASHDAIAHDLAHPNDPIGVLGVLVKALGMRRAAGHNPFTVLCCDNLPDNGALLRAGVLDFAARIDGPLAAWIAQHGAFPSTMVDRITPATTNELVAVVSDRLGVKDNAPVETEPFTQWVIEDQFADGRPAWERAGVLFVDDVAPYENMKLRMLNGAHSLIAYLGVVQSIQTVCDVMANASLASLVQRHIAASAHTLAPLQGVDFSDYAASLMGRFDNPNIRHETYQIAMDGSQKMPQRIFAPACDALDLSQDTSPFAYATAAWLRYCVGRTDTGDAYDLRDPRQNELLAASKGREGDAEGIFDAVAALPELMPMHLSETPAWREQVCGPLTQMLAPLRTL